MPCRLPPGPRGAAARSALTRRMQAPVDSTLGQLKSLVGVSRRPAEEGEEEAAAAPAAAEGDESEEAKAAREEAEAAAAKAAAERRRRQKRRARPPPHCLRAARRRRRRARRLRRRQVGRSRRRSPSRTSRCAYPRRRPSDDDAAAARERAQRTYREHPHLQPEMPALPSELLAWGGSAPPPSVPVRSTFKTLFKQQQLVQKRGGARRGGGARIEGDEAPRQHGVDCRVEVDALDAGAREVAERFYSTSSLDQTRG